MKTLQTSAKEIYSKAKSILSIDEIDHLANDFVNLFDGDKIKKIESAMTFLESNLTNKEYNALILMIVIYDTANDNMCNHICDSINLFIYHNPATEELTDFIKKRIAMEPNPNYARHYKDQWLDHEE